LLVSKINASVDDDKERPPQRHTNENYPNLVESEKPNFPYY
jgi:hypothetical protein